MKTKLTIKESEQLAKEFAKTNMGVVEFLQNKKAEWNIPDDYTIQGVDAYRQIIVTKGEMK